MLYLGIDQHHKQITVSIRDEEGTRDCAAAGEYSARQSAGVSRRRPPAERRRRVSGRRGSLRVQRLADGLAAGVWLPGSRADSPGQTLQAQDRPPARTQKNVCDRTRKQDHDNRIGQPTAKKQTQNPLEHEPKKASFSLPRRQCAPKSSGNRLTTKTLSGTSHESGPTSPDPSQSVPSQSVPSQEDGFMNRRQQRQPRRAFLSGLR
jgi:hypothetical protein